MLVFVDTIIPSTPNLFFFLFLVIVSISPNVVVDIDFLESTLARRINKYRRKKDLVEGGTRESCLCEGGG